MLYEYYKRIVEGKATYKEFRIFMILLDLHSFDNDYLIDLCKKEYAKEKKRACN